MSVNDEEKNPRDSHIEIADVQDVIFGFLTNQKKEKEKKG